MRILVTGAAGFIGAAVSRRLLDEGHRVVGIDNVNDYYDPALKEARLGTLRTPAFSFVRASVEDGGAIERVFTEAFDVVVHLAAQAGVRHSLNHPFAYTSANITGFLTILEACRHSKVPHLVYASSSSVYGLNTKMPFATSDAVDHPASLYAATKRANELMAHSYSHLFGLRTTGIRFFTVYGPWGRPDMALFSFTKKILGGESVPLFNRGEHSRSFTYIDDVIEGLLRLVKSSPMVQPTLERPDRSKAPFALYNLGSRTKVPLMEYVKTLEQKLGKTARLELLPAQAGDVPDTEADISDLSAAVGYEPKTSIDEGIGRFVSWYRDYYAV